MPWKIIFLAVFLAKSDCPWRALGKSWGAASKKNLTLRARQFAFGCSPGQTASQFCSITAASEGSWIPSLATT